jgi:D-alanyl-D-alanine dipeptidase
MGRPEPIRALNRIPEHENGEPLVDMRQHCPSIKLLRPTAIPWCRKAVAEMAERAARKLPQGMYFGLVEAWRPLARQQRIYDFMWKGAAEAFPHRDHVALRRTVNRWVAPTDQPAPPGHCTGAALDLWLVDENVEPIDVWSPYPDRFIAAPTFTYGLTEEAMRNRFLLYDGLVAEGFSNCRDEWWHYSYGDAGWAVRSGKPTCFYGLIELPEHLYREYEKLSIESFKDRPNPFLLKP